MTQITKQQREMVDKLYWSPSERADAVYSILREYADKMPEEAQPSMWDTLAFCVEYIGAQSIALGIEEFSLHAQRLSRLFYSFHYSDPKSIYGEPDKPMEESNGNGSTGEQEGQSS